MKRWSRGAVRRSETARRFASTLRMLRTENLVKRRRVAKHIYYSLADHHITGLIRSALEHANEEPEESDE